MSPASQGGGLLGVAAFLVSRAQKVTSGYRKPASALVAAFFSAAALTLLGFLTLFLPAAFLLSRREPGNLLFFPAAGGEHGGYDEYGKYEGQCFRAHGC